MDATGMALVSVIIGGISLQSPEPVTIEQCEAFKATQPQTLCVDVEPACGKSTGTPCLGRADLDDQPQTATKKKRTRYASRYRRHYR